MPDLSAIPSLPPLLTVREIKKRLWQIFPEEFPDRGILVGEMAARVVFVFLYGGFVEGANRFLRPSYIYLFTSRQSNKRADDDRQEWLRQVTRSGYRAPGKRWYADTTREPIRDDLMRNRFLPLGIMQKLPGYSPVASVPVNYLSADFAALFRPGLASSDLRGMISEWQAQHLDRATIQRMKLRGQGIQSKKGDFLVDLPDGTRIRITAGASSHIAKSLIEDFATRHLESPALLWLSASDTKAIPQFVALAASIGLKFDLGSDLPDVILAEMRPPVRLLFCEIVASDGPVTELRKNALLGIVRASEFPSDSVDFLSAFEDRESAAFRKSFSRLALGSLVWFRTEPNLLVVLSTSQRSHL